MKKNKDFANYPGVAVCDKCPHIEQPHKDCIPVSDHSCEEKEGDLSTCLYYHDKNLKHIIPKIKLLPTPPAELESWSEEIEKIINTLIANFILKIYKFVS